MFEHVNSQSTPCDVLLLSVPLTITKQPLMAGAVLKPVAERAGYSCRVVDLNILTINWLDAHSHKHDLLEFFEYDNITNINTEKEIFKFLQSVMDIVRRCNPKILGLSVFTFSSRAAAANICKKIREYFPNIQIIIGGAGIAMSAAGKPDFAEQLKKENLIDFYINGDAELSFYEYLVGNQTFSGINTGTWTALTSDDIKKLDYPNYNDYDWNQYEFRELGITGSRGCVRNCQFCDYIERWKKFVWRSADDIFDEMITQQQRYNVSNFAFSDSLINGNMKEYRRLVEKLANHNKTCDPDQRISWFSQFIFRSKNQFKEDLWELTALSGAHSLAIGIESFDDGIRAEIGKPFTNEDIDYGLDMMKKYNITPYFMFIIGHVNETKKHYARARQWFDDRLRYRDFLWIGFISTLIVSPNTYLDRNQEKLGITWIKQAPGAEQGGDHRWSRLTATSMDWQNEKTGNTPAKRSEWLISTRDHAINLGFKVIEEMSAHFLLSSLMSDGHVTADTVREHAQANRTNINTINIAREESQRPVTPVTADIIQVKHTNKTNVSQGRPLRKWKSKIII